MCLHQFQQTTLLRSADVLFELTPELADGILDRPTGAVGQAANRRAGYDAHLVAGHFQDVQILQSSLTAAYAFHDFQHPTRAFPTGRALAARFMRKEPTNII